MGAFSEIDAVMQEHADKYIGDDYNQYCHNVLVEIEEIINSKGVKSWAKYVAIKKVVEDNSRGYK